MTIVPSQAGLEATARAICAADPEIRMGDAEGVVQQRVEREWRNYLDPARAARQAFLTEILDHLTTEHSGGLGSHPGARVLAEALEAKFGEGQRPS